MIDVTQIVLAVIGLISAVITAMVIPWIRVKLGDARYNTAMGIVAVVVQAAEQLYSDPGMGKTKLTYAMEQVRINLEARGITFSTDIIRAMIESKVLALQE